MKSQHLIFATLILALAPRGQCAGDDIGPETVIAQLKSMPYKIVFESYASDNWDLHVIRADGSDRRNLTSTPKIHELYPQAAPDGSKICFLADVDRDGETLRGVYYMNTDGSGRTLVAEKARQPCWNADGTKIAFLRQEFERFNVIDYVSKGLFIYDLASGEIEEHPNEKLHHLYGLNWSSDGNWFVSTVHGGMGYGHAILAIEAGGDHVIDLKMPGCRPNLRPDGKRVTWSSDDHTISVADLTLTSPKPMVSNIRTVDKRKEQHLYHPDLSPDGRFIAYSVGPGGRVLANGPGTHTQVAEMVGVRGKWNLFVSPVDGEGPAVQITQDETLSNKEPEWIVDVAAETDR